MERRHCCVVIKEMLEKVPEDKAELIKDLNWNYEDASYKAPEETLQWNRTMKTLMKHIPEPKQDWEWEVLSIFTTKDVDTLKQQFLEDNEQKKD